ncbi:hypothetical protein E4H04_11385, partial [Candidatus Bathyarchaeota archaeon]
MGSLLHEAHPHHHEREEENRVSQWQKVKNMIEKDLDRIFWEEPEEITMCKKGIYPSGANVGGQILGNLV